MPDLEFSGGSQEGDDQGAKGHGQPGANQDGARTGPVGQHSPPQGEKGQSNSRKPVDQPHPDLRVGQFQGEPGKYHQASVVRQVNQAMAGPQTSKGGDTQGFQRGSLGSQLAQNFGVRPRRALFQLVHLYADEYFRVFQNGEFQAGLAYLQRSEHWIAC